MNHISQCKTQNYKTWEVNKGENLWDLEFSKVFLYMTPKAQSIKEKKISQLDLIEITSFFSEKPVWKLVFRR